MRILASQEGETTAMSVTMAAVDLRMRDASTTAPRATGVPGLIGLRLGRSVVTREGA